MNDTAMARSLTLGLFGDMVVSTKATSMETGPLAPPLVIAPSAALLVPPVLIYYVFQRSLSMSAPQAPAIGSPAIPLIMAIAGVSVPT